MAAVDPYGARWPEPSGRGHYESYYVEVVRPGGGRALWLRCTASRRPGETARGAVWAAFVDDSDAGPVALRDEDLSLETGDDDWIRCGDSTFGASGARGAVTTAHGAVSWDLSFASDEPPLLHLPMPWMYRARLPRTKLVSPMPAVRVDGRISVNGRAIDVDGWRGVVGHNWGEEHANRWIWLNAVVTAGPHSGSWLDVAVARVRVGGLLLPWTAFGAIRIDEQRLPLGGLGRRSTVHASATECTLVVTGAGLKVNVDVSAAARALVRWDYVGSTGAHHRVTNCPTADLGIWIQRRGGGVLEMRLTGCGVYEHGQAESV